jgi:hypothetical protein
LITLQRLATASWLVVFLAVYAPAVGHGFVSDDFGWVISNSIRSFADLKRVLLANNGFYRPVVALSFAANERMFGNRPLGYGVTNLALALFVAAGVFYLSRGFKLSKGASVLAAAVWLMNFHGMTWGLLWVSGRTSLLTCLGAVWAAGFVVRGRLLLATAFFAVALFAKEEAFLMSAVLLFVILASEDLRGDRMGRALAWCACAAAVTIAYLIARHASGAMTPSTAPPYYAFVFDLQHLAANAREYVDRVATPSALVVVAGLALLGAWPELSSSRKLASCCAIWITGGLGVTFFLPVRSDLYALLPSVGACVLAAGLLGGAWKRAGDRRRRVALVAAVAAPILLSPIYVARTHRRVDLADLSRSVLTDLEVYSRPLPPGAFVTIEDDQSHRANLDSAFAGELTRGFALWSGRSLRIEVLHSESPRPEATADCPPCPALRLRLRNFKLERAD